MLPLFISGSSFLGSPKLSKHVVVSGMCQAGVCKAIETSCYSATSNTGRIDHKFVSMYADPKLVCFHKSHACVWAVGIGYLRQAMRNINNKLLRCVPH